MPSKVGWYGSCWVRDWLKISTGSVLSKTSPSYLQVDPLSFEVVHRPGIQGQLVG